MTDKKIIIDGVDVSGCMYHKMNNKMVMCKACNSGVGSPYCEYNKDCYYKQHKSKEQECEELKFKSNYFKMVYNERTQECQELERRLKNTGEEKDIHIKEKEHLYKELEKAEQKLEKIKKVCNKFIPDHYKILLIINGGIVEE